MPQSSQTTPNDTYDLAAVIASGQTTSGEIDLGGVDPCGFFIPASFTGSSLSFLAAPSSGGTYSPVRDGSGALYTVAISASSYIVLPDIVVLAGVRWLKLVSSAAEAADRSVVIAARPM